MSKFLDALLMPQVEDVQKNLPRGRYEIKRLSQLTGETVEVELRGLPYDKAQELRQMENDQEVMILLVGCPELKDPELKAKFGGVTPAETVKAMLTPGEIVDLSRAVERLTGYRQNTIREIKNA